MRRRTLATGILAATAVLALTACTDTKQPESRTSAPPAKTPAVQLADAAGRLKNDTFKMTMTVKIDTTDARLDGAMDRPGKSAPSPPRPHATAAPRSCNGASKATSSTSRPTRATRPAHHSQRRHCLVYDRPLAAHGLTWTELTGWWADREGMTGAARPRT